VNIFRREAVVEIAWVDGAVSGSSEAAVIEVSAAFKHGLEFTLSREVPCQHGCVRFGRDTHAGFSGVYKRKAETSGGVITESTGNDLRTSRFQYEFSAGSEATTNTFSTQRRHDSESNS